MRKMLKKMGFLVLAKHGLNKHEIRPKSGLILRERTVERERREGEKRRRRRRREEEEEKREKQAKITGMELWILYGTNLGIDHMEFVWNSRKV